VSGNRTAHQRQRASVSCCPEIVRQRNARNFIDRLNLAGLRLSSTEAIGIRENGNCKTDGILSPWDEKYRARCKRAIKHR